MFKKKYQQQAVSEEAKLGKAGAATTMLLSFICEHYSMKKLIIYFRRLEKKNCCIPEKIGGLIIFIEEYKDTDILAGFFNPPKLFQHFRNNI